MDRRGVSGVRCLLVAIAIATLLTACAPPAPRYAVSLDPAATPAPSPAEPGPASPETGTPGVASSVTTSPPKQATPATRSAEATRRPAAKPAPPRTDLIGFHVNWDETSYRSLEAHIDDITILMPMWYSIDYSGRVRMDDAAKQERAMDLVRARRPDLPVMPILHSATTSSRLAALLGRADVRERIARDVVAAMRAGGFEGVNVDIEGLPASSKPHLTAFMASLVPKAHAAKLVVSQDVVLMGSSFDLAALGRLNDFVLPMMYDEHWKTSPAGPIASHDWYTRHIGRVFSLIPPKKVVLALGAWSYEWASGTDRATSYTYAQALEIARARRQPIVMDPTSLNPTFGYREGSVTHSFWMLDAATLFNQVKTAAPYRPKGYALWRLGHEDPAAWRVLRARGALDAVVARSLAGGGRTIEYDAARGLIVGGRVAP